MSKVVAHYLDGRLEKGHTVNFDTREDHFHVTPEANPYGEGVRVPYDQLKAVFFVKSLEGNPGYQDREAFSENRAYGRRVRVHFADGETLLGVLQHPDDDQLGVMLHPPDPESNNHRAFAMFAAMDKLVFLEPPSGHAQGPTPVWDHVGELVQVENEY